MTAFNEEKLKGRGNNIAISSTCNSNCLFCSNHQNPFSVKRVGLISNEDFLKQLFYVEHYSQGQTSISLSDVLPGTISEGEALLHPQLPDFIIAIRKRLPVNTKICITTNGALLTDDKIKFLGGFNPIEVSVSVPSFNKDHWLKMFGVANESFYETAVSSFEKMNSVGLGVSASIVPLPSMTGWSDLEETVRRLKEYRVNTLTIWYPGYTKYTPNKEFLSHVKAISFDDIHKFFSDMSRKYGVYIKEMAPDSYCSTESHNYSRITEIFRQAYGNGAKNVLWMTSVAAHEFVKQEIEEVGRKYPFISNTVKPVPNKTYGGNIASAGLLMVSDVIDAVGPYKDGHDLIVLPPPIFINRLGEDLMGKSVCDFEATLGGVPFVFA